MKSFELLIVLTAVVAVTTVVNGQRFGNMDLKQIPNVMKNRALITAYVKCFMATDREAVTICDRTGKQLRPAVPKAIEQGDCPDNCTPQEKVALAQALQIFQRDYAEEFEKLKVHYKATPEQLKQLQEWIDAQLATTKTA